MEILIDTSVWSAALRHTRATADSPSRDVQELIDEGRVVMIGPVRQELLSGVKSERQFNELRDVLRAFPDRLLSTDDFEEAALCFNTCRRRGVQGSHTDFLICAVARRDGLEIFTSDDDFERFRKPLRLKLYERRF
ncbi:MAG TPA: PIN domain-containing protein [Thermoanaerobaculia bacterium]|nr:PIN domain-containing protein [Thermoanaerobaculia bacterium]